MTEQNSGRLGDRTRDGYIPPARTQAGTRSHRSGYSRRPPVSIDGGHGHSASLPYSDLTGLRGTRRLRLGPAFVIACLSFASCTTQAPPPAPLQIAIPPMASGNWSAWRLVTDFTSRVDIPGASVLPPPEHGYAWTMARNDKPPAETIGFRAAAHGPNGVLVFVAASQTIPPESWRAFKGLRPEAFAQLVRGTWRRAESKYDDLEVTATPDVNVACARFRASGPLSGRGYRLAQLQIGRVCFHPDAPRLIVVVAVQATLEGTSPLPIDEMANGFLDGLQFRPLGVAWRGSQLRMIGTFAQSLPAYSPLIPMLVAGPSHRAGWVFEEKVLRLAATCLQNRGTTYASSVAATTIETMGS